MIPPEMVNAPPIVDESVGPTQLPTRLPVAVKVLPFWVKLNDPVSLHTWRRAETINTSVKSQIPSIYTCEAGTGGSRGASPPQPENAAVAIRVTTRGRTARTGVLGWLAGSIWIGRFSLLPRLAGGGPRSGEGGEAPPWDPGGCQMPSPAYMGPERGRMQPPTTTRSNASRPSGTATIDSVQGVAEHELRDDLRSIAGVDAKHILNGKVVIRPVNHFDLVARAQLAFYDYSQIRSGTQRGCVMRTSHRSRWSTSPLLGMWLATRARNSLETPTGCPDQR